MTIVGGTPRDSALEGSPVFCTVTLGSPRENGVLNNICTESDEISNLEDSL